MFSTTKIVVLQEGRLDDENSTISAQISRKNFFFFLCLLSLEVGQIFGKRPSNSGLLADLPPIHPHSPRPGTGGGHFSTAQNRRTSTQSSVPSVPSSPILGHRNSNRGYSPVRDQRLFIASFCRLDNELLKND